MKNWGLGRMGVILVLAGLAWSCSSDCDDEIAAAGRFLTAAENLQCKTDDDCVLVFTKCHTFEGGLCGISQLSRTAANSSEWSRLAADMDRCDEDDCLICQPGISPSCNQGRCGLRRN